MPSEFRACSAIVTKIEESHCTVIALDSQQQIGQGECWPRYRDLPLADSKLRLGRHVVVQGMSGVRTRHLNGLTGVIAEHPKEGHPVFIRRPASPDDPTLVVCVRFDDPVAARGRSSLLEPRFLVTVEEAALTQMRNMHRAAAKIQASIHGEK